MIDAFRQFAKKYPSRTLLMCGMFLSVLPVGVGANTKLLVEHDLIPDRYYLLFQRLMPFIACAMFLVMLLGLILIGMSALVAVRRLSKPKNGTSATPTA